MSDTPVVRCPSCGAANRVLPEKIEQGLGPVCGRCKKPLPIASKPVTVTDATFAAEVERSWDGVKMRTRASVSGASARNTNVVSGRAISFAIRCIRRSSMPAASGNTASWMPANG
jgi:hypothetical protein